MDVRGPQLFVPVTHFNNLMQRLPRTFSLPSAARNISYNQEGAFSVAPRLHHPPFTSPIAGMGRNLWGAVWFGTFGVRLGRFNNMAAYVSAAAARG